MSRIAATFAALRERRAKALIPYLTSGDPHVDSTAEIMAAMAVAGAIFIACATACADSSAGMMPSLRQSSWNAASASSSVTATYCARLLSFSQACSGPTPG